MTFKAHADLVAVLYLTHALATDAHQRACGRDAYCGYAGREHLIRQVDLALVEIGELAQSAQWPHASDAQHIRWASAAIDALPPGAGPDDDIEVLRSALRISYWAILPPTAMPEPWYPDLVGMLVGAIETAEKTGLAPWRWCGHTQETWAILHTLLVDHHAVEYAHHGAQLLTGGR